MKAKWLAVLCALLMLGGGTASWADCYKIPNSSRPDRSVLQTHHPEVDTGIRRPWSGAIQQAGQVRGLPATVNINALDFQPLGTILASANVPFYEMSGDSVAYDPEQILFICEPQDADDLYELYATNAKDNHAGRCPDGDALGIEHAYRSPFAGLLVRVHNTTTGQPVTHIWKQRQLGSGASANDKLARDAKGWILVKAKNFSNMHVELIRGNNENGLACPNGSSNPGSDALNDQPWPAAGPVVYIVFKGPGLPSEALQGGMDHVTSSQPGWPGIWPGAINIWPRVTVKRRPTCLITSVTPVINFGVTSVTELEQGKTVVRPIKINMECQSGNQSDTSLLPMSKISGTNSGQTALGIKPHQLTNYMAAVQEGLMAPGGSTITHLLSDHYHSANHNVAKGVGVAFSRKNAPHNRLNLLRDENIIGGGAANGWYPVLDDAQYMGQTPRGTKIYVRTIDAILTRLPNKTVQAGRIKADAQIVVRVQ